MQHRNPALCLGIRTGIEQANSHKVGWTAVDMWSSVYRLVRLKLQYLAAGSAQRNLALRYHSGRRSDSCSGRVHQRMENGPGVLDVRLACCAEIRCRLVTHTYTGHVGRGPAQNHHKQQVSNAESAKDIRYSEHLHRDDQSSSVSKKPAFQHEVNAELEHRIGLDSH